MPRFSAKRGLSNYLEHNYFLSAEALSFLASMSSSTTSSPVKTVFAPSTSPAIPTLIDFLNNVPSPLVSSLVTLSPYITAIRWTIEVLNWKSSYSDSWLALAAWWAVCLLSGPVLRYALPVVFISAIASGTWLRRKPQPRPTTEQTLQSTIVDLTAIESNIPSLPEITIVPLHTLLRASAILYVPYLVLTYIVRLRVLLAITGTILLTWRAPWARTVRLVLWRSAWVRWSLYRIWSRLSGQPISQHSLAITTKTRFTDDLPTHTSRFVFTIFENQRWWVGLDWTAALLPAERPSWSAASQQPLAPPSAFALPQSRSVVMDDGHGGVVRRTARWTWEEGEWRVVVKRVDGGLRRVERMVPSTSGKDDQPASPSGKKFDKTVKKMKELGSGRVRSGSTSKDGEVGDVETLGDVQTVVDAEEEGRDHVDGDEHESEEPFTDVDGWVYGDNQWKGSSPQGGIGKYTRYRRWTRIAVLSEIVEPATAAEVQEQIRRTQQSVNASKMTPNSSPTLTKREINTSASGVVGEGSEAPASPVQRQRSEMGSTEEEKRTLGSPSLRQRLKAVVHANTLIS
ncbi:hypothetical protein BD410DRAFT_802050 [Rickenella mellea]|uniref:Peroxin/Ferlin domain-containing protein n=1 Tax=Rickenella mellea TaxID=50990 RepID=A0A4Y7Q950_9AGAM|nr:hypothetical protein BD410DRAFT_802050 [Rickenella mellea]